MAFTRPTLAQLNERIQADIKSKLGNESSILRRSWVSIFGRVVAGGLHLVWGYIQWVYRQLFVTSADDEAIIAKALVYGITRKPPAYAFGTAAFTGTPGVTVPIGTPIIRPDGLRYLTTASAVLDAIPVEIPIRAAEVGAASNYAAASALQLESPLGGVDDEVTVVQAVGGGTTLETIEELRDRYLLRIRKPPQGGAKSDYELWAKNMPDVGTVKVYAPGEISTLPYLPPVGSVWVYFSTSTGDTPTNLQILDMQNYLDSKKPITATVTVHGTVIRMIQVAASLKVASGSTLEQAKTDVKNQLIDLMEEEAIPTATLFLSKINEAIARPSSVSDHTLLIPIGPILLGTNEVGRLDETFFTNNSTSQP